MPEPPRPEQDPQEPARPGPGSSPWSSPDPTRPFAGAPSPGGTPDWVVHPDPEAVWSAGQDGRPGWGSPSPGAPGTVPQDGGPWVGDPYAGDPYVGVPPTSPHRRRPVVVVGAALAILAMLAVGVGGAVLELRDESRGPSDPEVATLLDRVESTEAVMKSFQAQAGQAGSLREVQAAGGRAARALTERRSSLEALAVGGEVGRARDVYLEHVDEWIETTQAYAAGRQPTNGDDVDRTFVDACRTFRALATEAGDRARVDEICSEETGGAREDEGLRV